MMTARRTLTTWKIWISGSLALHTAIKGLAFFSPGRGPQGRMRG